MSLFARVLYILLLLTGSSCMLYAQVQVTDRVKAGTFVLSSQTQQAQLLYDEADHLAVQRAVNLFAEDVKRVSGKEMTTATAIPRQSAGLVVAGTIGKSRFIDRLIADKKLDIADIRNQWEQYSIQLIKNPFPGVKQALVIAGSDRRAVAYGLFSVSEAIGVSPWYWWADVAVKKRDPVYLNVQPFVSPAPSVKYRGIFINDEDWGLLPWAKHTFDPELKDIGPKTYAKVFELLLRLKANYLCPAMHEASGAFNKYPGNKLVADSFGIVMGSVHPEPLLFNNASEWDKKTMGEWNYMTNKEGILKVLDKRVKENAAFENVYTLALRGLHDKAMSGNYTLEQRVKLVSEALKDQRHILSKYIKNPVEEIPQAFTPYKEVLDLYVKGMELPDDVILVWPDDNYGYMKQLSNAREQKRSGGSGVYYHASYLGIPHDYLWISSTPPALMYEELSKAYNTGANRLWLLNAGDIKSCEFPVTLFLDMAYDVKKFSFENIPDYQAHWLSSIFGNKYLEKFKTITRNYNRLSFARKPEFMGWGFEWNTFKNGRERPTDTDLSFINYNEAEKRLKDFSEIGASAENILNDLPEEEKPSFFQLLYYPVKGAELMNKKWLTAQKSRLHTFQGRNDVNALIGKTKHYYDSLYKISYQYNDLLNGKWKRILSLRQGVTASYFELPESDSVRIAPAASMKLMVEGQEPLKGGPGYHLLPVFNRYLDKKYFVELFNTGAGSFSWQLNASDAWINASKTGGTVTVNDRIFISINWSEVPVGENVTGEITITSNNGTEKVLVTVFNPAVPAAEDVKGLYIEDNGLISIDGAGFHRKKETGEIKMQVIDNLGYEDKAVMIGNPTAKVQNPRDDQSPGIEYDFFTFNRGPVDVYTYVLPTFPLSSDRDFGFHEQATSQTRYAVCIDNGAVTLPSSSSPEYSQSWYENVLRNAAINKSTFYIDKPGKHTLHIKCGDPGIVIQKIVLDFGGMKRSYLGPPPTRVH